MNRFKAKTRRAHASTDSGEDRDMFVVDDYSQIPAGELRKIVGGTGRWLKTIIGRMFVRSKPHPSYVIELRRLTKAKHIPKRMEKYFDDLFSKLGELSFHPNFEASIPAVGPYVLTVVAMSRRDGDIHFLGRRITRQCEGQLVDEGDFRFLSWLEDGGVLVTTTQPNLPRSQVGIDLMALRPDDPTAVLKKHRERMRNRAIETVSPPDLFDRIDAINRQEVEDLLRRKIIRQATPGEVARIRAEMRV